MQLTDLFAAIDIIAPLAAAASWDASGLQVAAQRRSASKLAVCLDPTPTSIGKALEAGAQCILSHHPLTLKPELPKRLDAYHECLRLLFCADVPLYAAHTSLDVNPCGPAGWLADELDLANRCVLEPSGTVSEGSLPLGFGIAGDLPHPMTIDSIMTTIARHAPLTNATLCGPEPQSVHRVAYCTGSGSSLLQEAYANRADIFITGDVKYHTALDTCLCILDVGHHSLEEEMMRRMSLLLQQRLEGVDVFFVSSVSPFRYMAF